MEGMGTFELAGSGGDGNMATAVHTRRIIDPGFGIKLTGTVGKVTFAALSSSDRDPGNTDSTDPLFGQKEYFNIARALYSLGKGTYIGGLVTDTELGSGHNRVAAGDISLQFGKHQQLTATAITSVSRDSDGSNPRDGMAGQATYTYSSKQQIFRSHGARRKGNARNCSEEPVVWGVVKLDQKHSGRHVCLEMPQRTATRSSASICAR
jgi:hypothetical protein